MENLAVASSNLVAITPIVAAWYRQEYLVSMALLFAMSMSIMYHLIETEKHQLPGMFGPQVGQRYHNLAINLDRFAALTAISVTLYRFHTLVTLNLIRIGLISLMFLSISELNKRSYWIYLVSHCIWHISAFGLALNLVSLS